MQNARKYNHIDEYVRLENESYTNLIMNSSHGRTLYAYPGVLCFELLLDTHYTHTCVQYDLMCSHLINEVTEKWRKNGKIGIK